jgi:hypothetical protein
LDGPFNLQSPGVCINVGHFEVTAYKETLVGREISLRGGEGKLQIVWLVLSNYHVEAALILGSIIGPPGAASQQ